MRTIPESIAEAVREAEPWRGSPPLASFAPTMRPHSTVLRSLALAIAAAAPSEGRAQRPSRPAAVEAVPYVDTTAYRALRYRMVGPSRGGRSTAVSGVPGSPHSFFMGTAGGVWRTDDAGTTWSNVSDSAFETGSIGAIAVAPSDANVVYVGTGQGTLRGNVSIGFGVYKSTDGGRTWRSSGLRGAGQIAKIRVHPTNPDLLYAAVIGNPFGPSADRGVFRSRDGGASWQKIFFVSAKTGVADLAMDPTNPRVLYAAAWTGQRLPWTIISGSAESGLYKSTDGGDSWVKLSGGLPSGVVGKIGIAISPANPDRVWAMVEAEPSVAGLYRSDNAGQSWQRFETKQKRRLYQRSWYFTTVFADPKNANALYVLNVDSFHSEDGGRSFEAIKGLPHGDGHDLWINPADPDILIEASDGGASVSLNHGRTWSTINNQPTAEMYYVAVDSGFPYRIFGGQQDNTTISVPSLITGGLSPTDTWRDVGGCEDANPAVAHNPSILYAGCYGGEITRVNLATDEIQNILVYPQNEIGVAPRDLRYRFNWNAPIRVSPHDPHVLYHASQLVHRSTNDGQSWEAISPDLSRNDKSKEDFSGAPLSYENTGVEVYANILTFEESPVKQGVLWAGSDDGLVHVSRDNGKSWVNVTPRAMPEWGSVNIIEPSPHDPARAFIAVLKYMLGDWKPYVFVTNDYGASWALLTTGRNGIPIGTPTRSIREDPQRKGLLYAATEFGVYVSFDDGRRWQPLQLNLPRVPVTDLRVHRNDLIISTQGRSYWVLDDVTPLRQITPSAVSAPVFLFQPRDTYRVRLAATPGDGRTADNPPNGALIFYHFAGEPTGEVTIDIADSSGATLAHFSSDHMPSPRHPEMLFGASRSDTLVSKKAGMNRFVWDLHYPEVDIADSAMVWGYTGGPPAPPGTYTVRLTAGGQHTSRTLRLERDPRIAATDADLVAERDLLLRLHGALGRTYDAVRTIRAVRAQSSSLLARLADSGHDTAQLAHAATALNAKLTMIEEDLVQPRVSGDNDTENFPTKLDGQIAYLFLLTGVGDSRPTDGQRERATDLERELAGQLARLDSVLRTDLGEFNASVARLGLPAIVLPVGTAIPASAVVRP